MTPTTAISGTASTPGGTTDVASDGTPRSKPLRADAQRNRDGLLRAADELFTEEGAEASLDDIARRAGVGIGTLYRHFPTRQALLEGVFLARAVELRELGEVLAGSDHDPREALVIWLRAQMRMGRRGRSLGSAVLAAKHEEGTEINLACSEMFSAGEQLLVRAQAAGQVGDHVQIGDVLRTAHGIVLATEGLDDGAEQAERMLDLLVGGLAAGT